MNDFSLTDAAIADKVLAGVPPDQTDDQLAGRGFPSAFDDLLQQYRMLQQKVQQDGAAPPQTTVAQDIMGLAALNNQLSPQAGQAIQQLAAQNAPGAGQPMPPQGQPPMEQGLGGMNAGVMQNPQFANGGIIAFANRGAVQGTADNTQEDQEPMTYNTYMASMPTQNTGVVPEQQPRERVKLPSSFGEAMQSLQEGASNYEDTIEARKQALKNRMIYQAKPDPSIEEDRTRINALKLANENDLEPDRWQAMVDMGLAWAESAARGDDPLVSLVAGSKAGVTSLRKINDEYKKTQAALDKELIALDHAKYLAEETNNKDAYNQVYKIQDTIDGLDDKLDALNRDVQTKAAGLYIQHQQATTKSTANPSNYEIQMGIELAVLREQNNKLPPDQRKSEAELRQKASQNAMFNAGQQLKLQNAQDQDFNTRYIKEANNVRTALSDPSDRSVTPADRSRYRQAQTAQEKEQIIQELVNARLSIVPTPPNAAPPPPAPGAGSSSSSSSASSQPKRISLSQLPTSRG